MTKKDQSFGAWDLQGKLFLHDQILHAFVRKNSRQKDEDYRLAPGLTIKDECSRAFRIAQASWELFKRAVSHPDAEPESVWAATKAFAKNFFSESLGYRAWAFADERTVVKDGRGFAVQAFANDLPVVIVPGSVSLDEPQASLAIENGGRQRKTAFQCIQEFLNASQDYRWGFCFNGRAVRLVRDAMSLTRPSYLEFNLEEIFTAQSFADFLQLWAVLHASRGEVVNAETAWDLWIKAGEESGQPVRDKLSEHVSKALRVLGNGFLKEPSNHSLREVLASGSLTPDDYVHELLRLMYRFLFVFCLEERDLIHPKVDESSPEGDRVREAINRYRAGYSLHRFRDISKKSRFRTRYTDAWESVKIVFRSLANGEPALALPALGGLFNEDVTPWLDQSRLSNRDFFEVMELLRWATFDGVTTVIDYKNLGTEELGSVYEGLLELVPFVDLNERLFGFVGMTNVDNTRKSTGSYYTPDSLVQSLIRTALDPVIADAVANHPQNVEQALLKLRVIDPTCGSGHFLLAAARRIAETLAEYRSPDGVVTPDGYRESLRAVIEHCIYGVDINPLAVELARMALWLEGYSRGRPLSFLDHHLKVGNSVLGVGTLSQVFYGISNKAYQPQMGDDRTVCGELKRLNKHGLEELQKLQNIDERNLGNLFAEPVAIEELTQIETMGSDSLEDVRRQALVYARLKKAVAENIEKQKCDLYMTGYLSPKNSETAGLVPTTENLLRLILGEVTGADKAVIEYATKFCEENKIFHWPIEFAGVFAQEGFDCVLGNPPWDKAKVEDKKWFAYRHPTIANAEKAASRKRMIEALSRGTFGEEFNGLPPSQERSKAEQRLFRQYERAKQQSAAASVYGHLEAEHGGRFPHTGKGDTNLYAYVGELMTSIRNPTGTVGVVVPPGLVTDDAYKAFAQKMLDGEISSIYQFDNTEKIFPIDNRYTFALITFRKSETMECVFYASEVAHLEDEHRKLVFEKGDFERFNPNTQTCLFARTKEDLAVLRKMYAAAPVFLRKGIEGCNPWNVRTMTMFHMTNDSGLFHSVKDEDDLVPLYEGKLIHQFDDRFATYSGKKNSKGELVPEDVHQLQKEDPEFQITPRYWIKAELVAKELKDKSWDKPWMISFRDVSSPTNQRTLIASVLPSDVGAGNVIPLILPNVSNTQAACLLGNLNSLALDFVERIKQPSLHVNFFILYQIPVLPPESYRQEDQQFICERVAKLTRNSSQIRDVWLKEYPFYQWQSSRERLEIRAELDAYYAHLYGLTREELQYVLDPSAIYGEDFPSVTFPGLKRDEIAEYGEYLTQRLVLEAYDQLAETPRFARS